MSSAIEKRKLAAVMFADIEGYTALFQKNEGEAFSLVESHRRDLQETSTKHNGHIVKYYGDGSLTIFNSVIEATLCAIELQQVSSHHAIPLRIGLHMGEMIQKNKDVYGDAVNVASRIQAIGTKGSILVSKPVVEELKNHPTILSKSLGIVTLKNVKEPIEVFAIINEGLVIPPVLARATKKYRKRFFYVMGLLVIAAIAGLYFKDTLKNKYAKLGRDCIIIPPFIPYVSNPQLDSIGDLAASILSKVMAESADVEIINYTSALLYTNVNLASINDDYNIARRLGAKYLVQGNYTLDGREKDSLRFWMSIVDLYKNKNLPLSIPEVRCKTSDYMDCIDETSNILAGYWKSKKDYLFQYTNDSAYMAFLVAQKKWANRKYEHEIKSYLIKAIRYDPKFLDAWFLLLDYFHNKASYKNGIDSIAVIEKRFPDLDQRQQDYLGYYKYDFEGKNLLAFTSYLKEYYQNKKDLFVNTTGMVMALEYLNDPATTIHFFNQIDPDNIDLSTCTYCITRFTVAMKAYIDLPNLAKAGELASRIRPFASETKYFIDLLAYYTKVKDTASVNDIIRVAANKAPENSDEEPYLCLMTARIASVNGDQDLKQRYARRAIQYKGPNSLATVARAQMLIGDLEASKKNFLSLVTTSRDSATIYSYLGLLYARQGDRVKANQIIQKLNDIKGDYDMGMTAYKQGRIKANLGEYTEALEYLKIALDEGARFLPAYTFRQDPDMEVLNSNKDYISLLESNRQVKIE